MTTAVEPKHETITVNGLRLHYVDFGSPSPGALDMVMIHGLTSAWQAWSRVAAHFSSTYRVICLDQRGHGLSEWAAADAYTTDDYVSDLEQFVDALGLERFILIGHSMGGHNTIAYTARHPERIIMSIANDIPPKLNRSEQDYSTVFPGGKHKTFASIDEWLNPRRTQNPFTPEWAHELASSFMVDQVEGGYRLKHDPAAVMHWQPADLWDEAKTISRPIFFIRGGRSAVLEAQTLQDMDLAIKPARSVTLERSGHNNFWDMEHDWLMVADAFLGAHRDQ